MTIRPSTNMKFPSLGENSWQSIFLKRRSLKSEIPNVDTVGSKSPLLLCNLLSDITIWKLKVSVGASDGETDILTNISFKLDVLVVIGVGVDWLSVKT